MSIAILFRKKPTPNLFREFILNSLELNSGDNALMCSGFFQEARKGAYRASQEGNLAQVLVNTNTALTTVGIHNNTWTPDYRAFVARLRQDKVRVQAKICAGLRWHAKIFILRSGTVPLMAIIGSSNITRPAFSTGRPFNYEADVVLWAGAKRPFRALLKKSFPHRGMHLTQPPTTGCGLTINS